MPPFENNTGDEDLLSGLYGLTLDDGDREEPPHRPHPVPLTGVKVKAELHDLICEVKLSQCFHNNTPKNLECIYHFPIKNGAAICGFQADYQDGKVIQGVVKEKKAARNEYAKATKDGKQANLLEQVRGDVFTLKVGNLAVDAHVKITVTYVTTLESRHDSTTAFVLPTSIAPRYIPCSDGKQDNPSTTLAPPQSSVKLFGLHVEAEVFCRSTIQSIASHTHSTDLRATTSGTTGQLTLHDVTMDRDLVVLIQEETPHQPRASLEVAPDGTQTGFVTFVPDIEFPGVVAREFVFVVDRSGSMGNKMAQTRDTLLLFLRSLPPTCTFNIISFGSHFESLFSTPMPYNDETLEAASQHVTTMQANFGGTEIVAPLQHLFGLAVPTGERQVFVLTDGQVSNDGQVFDVIRQNCRIGFTSRLFSVGIGESVSRHLVSGMARAGRGTSCFVEDGSPRTLRVKVLGQLKQSLQPALDNVSIEWKFLEQAKQDTSESGKSPVKTLLGYRSPSIDQETKNPPSVLLYPSQNPPIFNKEKFLSYAMFRGDSAQPVGVVVKCETRDGPLSVDLPISGGEIYQGTIAKKLAARVAVEEFEEKRSSIGAGGISKSEALQLALSNGLASELTSFIAVHEDTVVDSGTQIETKVIPQASRVIPQASSPFYSSPYASGGPKKRRCRNPRGGRGHHNTSRRNSPLFAQQVQRSCDSTFQNSSPAYSSTSPQYSPTSPTDPVLRICLQQNANGEFVWNDNLVAALGLDRQQVKQLYEYLGSPDQKWFGTALALAVLRRSFAAQHNVWELQEQKALQVLLNSGGLLLVTRMEDEVAKMLPRSA